MSSLDLHAFVHQPVWLPATFSLPGEYPLVSGLDLFSDSVSWAVVPRIPDSPFMSHLHTAEQLAWDDPTSESSFRQEVSPSGENSMEVEEIDEGVRWTDFTASLGGGSLPKDDIKRTPFDHNRTR